MTLKDYTKARRPFDQAKKNKAEVVSLKATKK